MRIGQRAATDFHGTELPSETPCCELKQIRIAHQRSGAFGFVQRYLDHYAGYCVGQEGISLIVRRGGDLILDRGYVTTRVGLGKQDISKGVLTLTLVPGVVHATHKADDTASGDWTWALPIRPGDLLKWYAGIDASRASGPGTAYIPGNTTLTGGFFGLRGTYKPLSWDVFAGNAMHRGKVLENARPATGFPLVYAL